MRLFFALLCQAMGIHIGTSGWSYDHWQGVLYPHGTPVHDRLGYYVQRFQTVELNSGFYRWPQLSTFVGWRRLSSGIPVGTTKPFLPCWSTIRLPTAS